MRQLVGLDALEDLTGLALVEVVTHQALGTAAAVVEEVVESALGCHQRGVAARLEAGQREGALDEALGLDGDRLAACLAAVLGVGGLLLIVGFFVAVSTAALLVAPGRKQRLGRG